MTRQQITQFSKSIISKYIDKKAITVDDLTPLMYLHRYHYKDYRQLVKYTSSSFLSSDNIENCNTKQTLLEMNRSLHNNASEWVSKINTVNKFQHLNYTKLSFCSNTSEGDFVACAFNQQTSTYTILLQEFKFIHPSIKNPIRFIDLKCMRYPEYMPVSLFGNGQYVNKVPLYITFDPSVVGNDSEHNQIIDLLSNYKKHRFTNAIPTIRDYDGKNMLQCSDQVVHGLENNTNLIPFQGKEMKNLVLEYSYVGLQEFKKLNESTNANNSEAKLHEDPNIILDKSTMKCVEFTNTSLTKNKSVLEYEGTVTLFSEEVDFLTTLSRLNNYITDIIMDLFD